MVNAKKVKVVFFVPDLSGGGAERIVITFLENLDRDCFSPILCVCRNTGVYANKVPDDVPIVSLHKKSKWSFLLLIYRFRQFIKQAQPDVVISFLWYADVIQLFAKKNVKYTSICSFHTVPSAIAKDKLGWLKIQILKRVYRHADRILAVSKAVKDEIDSFLLNGQPNLTFVQYNPFDLNKLTQQAVEKSSWQAQHRNRIVFVGRLSWVKGPDIFLKVLSELPSDIQWHAKLVGTGEMLNQLVSQTQDYNLTDKVEFEGFVSNPFSLIKDADVLVVTSRFEAFPSVIVEALQLQTVVVAFDCPSGPKELINKNNGILVPMGETKAFATALKTLIDNPLTAKALAKNGPASVSHLNVKSATMLLEQHLMLHQRE